MKKTIKRHRVSLQEGGHILILEIAKYGNSSERKHVKLELKINGGKISKDVNSGALSYKKDFEIDKTYEVSLLPKENKKVYNKIAESIKNKHETFQDRSIKSTINRLLTDSSIEIFGEYKDFSNSKVIQNRT